MIKPSALKPNATIGVVSPSSWLNESDLKMAVSVFENNAKHGFSLFPNPATNLIFLKGDISAIEKIEVFNIFGQKVLSQYNTNKINISTLKSGMYFIKTNNNQTLKFIKQ